MLLRTAILFVGIFSLSGCMTAAVGAVGAVGVAAVQDRSMGESLDDASASSELKTKLLAAGPKKFAEVDVEVANGVCLLSGRVNSPEDKMEAENMAWTVRLLDDVANEIQIREAGGVRQNLNDEWITARVRTKLFTDGAVKSMNINIETYDGTVYLMGIARTNDELQRAAELASLVRGVNEVVSYMQVRAPTAVTGRGPSSSTVATNPYDPTVQ